MTKRRDYEPPEDLGDTVRALPQLSEEPGELRWRQQVNKSFEGVSTKLSSIDGRLIKIEAKQLSTGEVAAIAQKEMAVLVSKVDTLSHIVYGTAGAVATAILTGVVAIAIKVLK